MGKKKLFADGVGNYSLFGECLDENAQSVDTMVYS